MSARRRQHPSSRKSIPPACCPTSTAATVRNHADRSPRRSPAPSRCPRPSRTRSGRQPESTTPLATLRSSAAKRFPCHWRVDDGTDWPRLFVPTSSLPFVRRGEVVHTGPIGNRRVIVHVATSISTTSLDLLQATKPRPSTDGCARWASTTRHPGFGGSIPCPRGRHRFPSARRAAGSRLFPIPDSEPVAPCSAPFFKRKCTRDGERPRIDLHQRVIHHARRVCLVPARLSRDPCGMVQVVQRARPPPCRQAIGHGRVVSGGLLHPEMW